MSSSRPWLVGAFVAAVSLNGSIVFAQTGAIAGLVKDPTGAVLPGVTVEAASPALIEKTRSVVSDGQGLYKIVDLRPGTYSVTFTLPGFSTVKREGIELSVGFTATVNADLRVGTVQETVTVSGASPVVDVQNVVQQRVMTRDVIDNLPTGKTPQNLAVLVPGVVVGGAATGVTGQDVGGSVGERHVYLQVHGSRGLEMPLVMDGMRYNNMNAAGGGFSTSYAINAGAIQEVSVEIGAQSAEADVYGVRSNVIPRDGSNSLRGMFLGNFANGSMQANNVDDALRAQGLVGLPALDKVWDVNPSVGGPLRRDRLWYFASVRSWGNYDRPPGTFFDLNPNDYLYTPDTSRPGVNPTWLFSESVRLTTQASPRNKVTVFADVQQRCTCRWQMSSVRPPEAATEYRPTPNGLLQAIWSSPVSNRLLVEGGFTWRPETYRGQPVPEVLPTTYSMTELSTGITFGAAPQYVVQTMMGTVNGRASVSYVTGTHAFKVGFQGMRGGRETYWYANHDAGLSFLNGVPARATLRATPYTQEETLKADLGVFAQDQWTIQRLTMNLGVRFAYLNGAVEEKHLAAVQYVGARDFAAIPDAPNWKDIVPRAGMAYDLFGNGKTAIKGSFGGYLQGMATTLAGAVNPINASVNSATAAWTDLNGDFVPQSNELTGLDPNFGKTNIVTRYSDNLLKGWGKRGHDWEVQLSAQHELTPGLSVNVGYIRHWFRNFSATRNLALTNADFSSFCVTAPTDPRLPVSGQQVCGFYDIAPSKIGATSNIVDISDTIAGGDTQADVYDGFDFAMNARLPGGFLVQGGLNIGRERLNNCFLIDDRTLTFDSGFNGQAAGQNPPATQSPRNSSFCDVRPPFLAQAKGYVVYPLPWGLQASATFQSLPGPPILASYVARNAEVRPTLGRDLSTGPNGTVIVNLLPQGVLYGERLNQLDARFAKTFSLGRNRLQAQIDLYNLLNDNPVMTLNNRYGSAWLQPQSILPGRLLKLGAQWNF